MSVQSFVGANQGLAFTKVRKALGESAVIVEVRQRGGFVEVLARRGSVGSKTRSERFADTQRILQRAVGGAGGMTSEDSSAGPALEVANEAPGSVFAAGTELGTPLLSGGMRGTERQVAANERPGRGTKPLPPRCRGELAEWLDALDLPKEVHSCLERVCASAGANRVRGVRQLHAWLEQRHPTALPRARGGNGPIQLGFLGPERVGKSTLTRGLASRAAIEHPGRVLWVEAHFPQRPAPKRDPLYVPIGVDYACVHSEREILTLAEDYSDMRAVLFDLPGIRIHRPVERRALARFLRAAEQAFGWVQWSPVLPLTWSHREIGRALSALGGFRSDGVAWTFLDQSADAGAAISAAVRCDKSPSFVHGDSQGDGRSSRVAQWEELLTFAPSSTFREVTSHPSGEGQD